MTECWRRKAEKDLIQQKSPWRRIAITASAMVGVLLIAASYRYVESRGTFASVTAVTPALCHRVAGIGGVADIAADKAGNAYIAAADGLFVYDGRVVERLSGTPKNFHPAALAVSDDGVIATIFRQGETWDLSVFSVAAPATVKEMGRLSADSLTDPAALVALPGGRFYIVNKHASRTALGRWLDDTFLVPRAEIQFFDGMKFVTVATRLNSPAGVAMAPDGSHLYVSQELPRSLISFSRNDFTGALADAALTSLPAAPTKLALAKDGSLIVAAWPNKGTGAVYQVKTQNGVLQSPELIYGSQQGPVTAVAATDGHVLIGSGRQLLDCRL